MAVCWVAELLYGVNHIKTHLARFYTLNVNNWFTKLYRKHGKSWAEWLSKHRWTIPIVKPIWDYMAYKGKESIIYEGYEDDKDQL